MNKTSNVDETDDKNQEDDGQLEEYLARLWRWLWWRWRWLCWLFPRRRRFCGEIRRIIHRLRFLFSKWRSARAHQLSSLGLDLSTVAQRAEMTVDERSLTSCI